MVEEASQDLLASQLLEAIAAYEEQLNGIQQLLDEGSTDTELIQMKDELEEALQETRSAYSASFAAGAAATAAAAEAAAEGASADMAADAADTGAQPVAATAGTPVFTVALASQQGNPTQAGAAAAGAGAAAAAALMQRRPGNARMHPANRYFDKEPDFAALAARHPDLARFVTLPQDSRVERDGATTASTSGRHSTSNSAGRGGRGSSSGSSRGGSSGGGRGGSRGSSGRATIDFTSWEATRALTAALLADDYGVTWALPEGQLVPPVTNRANYVHWVADLLQLSSPRGAGPVRALDIGCGANLIYCLLGAAIYGWHMVGIDITNAAIAGAQANMRANPHLADLLEVRRVPQHSSPANGAASCSTGARAGSSDDSSTREDSILMPALANADEQFHFCMCNPPFFSSLQEANQNPNTACGGTPAEMVCPGGELAFIRRMVADSVQVRGSFHWYTTMVGKKDTLKAIRMELHALGVTALRTTELAQGKTSRWAIAWSFTVDRNLASQPLPRAAMHHVPHVTPAATMTSTHPSTSRAGTAGNSQAHTRSQAQSATPNAAEAAGAAPGSAGAAPSVVLPVRQASFRVLCPSQEAPKLLQALAALLTQRGAVCKVDAAAYSIQAQLPLAATVTDSQQQQGQQEQQGQQSMGSQGSAGQADEPPAKRARTGASAPPGAQASASALLSVRMSLFLEQRGVFGVKATIPNHTGDASARHFAAIMQTIQTDIDLMWHVQRGA